MGGPLWSPAVGVSDTTGDTPTIRRSGPLGSCMVGAGLAPALRYPHSCMVGAGLAPALELPQHARPQGPPHVHSTSLTPTEHPTALCASSYIFHITITLIRGQPFFLKDTPHLPGRNRNIDMSYPYMSQGVDNRIGDCLWSADSG